MIKSFVTRKITKINILRSVKFHTNISKECVFSEKYIDSKLDSMKSEISRSIEHSKWSLEQTIKQCDKLMKQSEKRMDQNEKRLYAVCGAIFTGTLALLGGGFIYLQHIDKKFEDFKKDIKEDMNNRFNLFDKKIDLLLKNQKLANNKKTYYYD